MRTLSTMISLRLQAHSSRGARELRVSERPWWSCCDDGSVQAHQVPRSVQVTSVLTSVWKQRSINGNILQICFMFYPYEGDELSIKGILHPKINSKNLSWFTHSYVVPFFLLQNTKTQKTILGTRLYWWTLTFTVRWYLPEYFLLCSTEDEKSYKFGKIAYVGE